MNDSKKGKKKTKEKPKEINPYKGNVKKSK
jgi:hypothetical protein